MTGVPRNVVKFEQWMSARGRRRRFCRRVDGDWKDERELICFFGRRCRRRQRPVCYAHFESLEVLRQLRDWHRRGSVGIRHTYYVLCIYSCSCIIVSSNSYTFVHVCMHSCSFNCMMHFTDFCYERRTLFLCSLSGGSSILI